MVRVGRRAPRWRRMVARCAVASALAAASVATGAVAGDPALTAARGNLAGVWRVEKPVAALADGDGRPVPLLPAAAKTYRLNQALLRAGDRHFDPTTWCSSPGIPRLMLIDYPFEVIVRPDAVVFRFEWNRWFRFADLSGADPEIIAPGATGVPMGRWTGDTLVIVTKGLTETSLLDNRGMPHSDALTLTERLRLTDANTLEDRMTFDDPKTFARPWSTVVTYQRQPKDTAIREDVCLDRIGAGRPAIRR